IGREFGATQHRAGALELAVIADHQHQFAVGAAEHAGRHAAIAPGAAPGRGLAVDEVDLQPMRQRGDHGVEQADVDMLPLAAIGLAMKERRENADRRVHAGHVVDNGRTDLHRARAGLAVDMTGDAHQAAHRLQDRVVAGARRIRPGLAEAGHRAIDDAGVDRLDRFIVELVAFEIADLVVLHHHVAGLCELADDLLSFRAGDIDGDRFLVAVGAEVERVVVVRLALGVLQVRRAEGAGVVAATGAFDLDHLGAEIGQHLRRQGACKHPRQVENFDARKWQSRHELPPNFLAWWRGTWPVALRSQADTLFYTTEPCITGMTPSVRGRFAHRWPNPKSTTARARRAVLASNRYRPARLPAGAGLGAAGPPFQEFA